MTVTKSKPKDTLVVWKTKRLAREYELSPISVGRLLKAIGAIPYNKSKGKWYWDIEEGTDLQI